MILQTFTFIHILYFLYVIIKLPLVWLLFISRRAFRTICDGVFLGNQEKFRRSWITEYEDLQIFVRPVGNKFSNVLSINTR